MAFSVVIFSILGILFVTGPVWSQTNNLQLNASQNPIPVGSSVTLFSPSPVNSGVWLFGTSLIVIILPTPNIPSAWKSRATFNSTTSSLTIGSLTVSDSGVFTLDAIDPSFSAQLTLSVQVPISNVTLTANATNLVEFNNTAVFMCSFLNGSLPSYVWMNGSSVVTAGGQINLSNGNATLTIINVTHYDKGPFTCNVSNGVSYVVSPPISLNISYGPSNTTMNTQPAMSGNHAYRTGSNISLTCSADSSPPAMIMWMVNNMNLNQSGPQLQLQSVTVNNSGNYTCIFYNSVTLRFNSASVQIWILEPLAVPALIHNGTGLAILNETFTLYCDVSGTFDVITWLKNNLTVSANNMTLLSTNTLTFNPVHKSDDGDYQCQAVNAVSIVTSNTYKVKVNYGPEMTTIMGPEAANIGDNITLTCQAKSYPPSFYTWYFNGSGVANTSQYVTPPLTINMAGNYTCVSYNNITGLSDTASKMLTVVGRITAVAVTAPNNPAIEGQSYMLTCNVTGPVDQVSWMMNGQQLSTNNPTHSVVNKTVNFMPVARNDAGSYQCVAMNAADNVTSSPYMLVVNFGPETPIIKGRDQAYTGHSAIFHCFALSVPHSDISWWFNGSKVADTSILRIDNLSFNQSGNYTCMAHNNVTNVTSTSMKTLKVIEALTSATIKNYTVPINSKNFTLVCDVVGSYYTISWMKDNQTLNLTSSDYYFKNNRLYFTPVTISNDGMYQCVASNNLTQQQSPQYNLLVNYGPTFVNITGPDSAGQGNNVTLTCSADSLPNCQFQWYFSSSSNSYTYLKSGAVVTFAATYTNVGNYTCQAQNSVTNITLYKNKVINLTGDASTHLPTHSGLMFIGVFALSILPLFN